MDESDGVRDLLVRGMAAAKAGSADEARFFLEWVLRSEASEDARAEAWWWMSRVAEDPAETRRCLEEVLARQPTHPLARRALAVLEGRLSPSAIIDPDHLPAVSGPEREPEGERFTCPRCGGRLVATADSQWLGCAYCGWRRSIETGEAAPEQDFVVAMATVRGHRRPERTRTFRCRGCGAPYLLFPESLSLACPYCASTHVVVHTEAEEIVPPDGVIPFGDVDPGRAAERALGDGARAAHTWLGLHLPLWSFQLSGEVPWKGVREDEDHRRRETVTGSILVLEKDHLVPATRRLPETWARPAMAYSTRTLRPFRPEILADWPAETYQVPMSDAAVRAHAEVFEAARTRGARDLPPDVREVSYDSTRFSFDSFRLILAPVWIGLGGVASPRPVIAVNGQSGAAASEGGRRARA